MNFEKLLNKFSTKVKGKDPYILCRVNKWKEVAIKLGIDVNSIEIYDEKYPSELENIILIALFRCYTNYENKYKKKYTLKSYIYQYWDVYIEEELIKKSALDGTYRHVDTVYIRDDGVDLPNIYIDDGVDLPDIYIDDVKLKNKAIQIVESSNLSDEVKNICLQILNFKSKATNIETRKKRLKKVLKNTAGVYVDNLDTFLDDLFKDVKKELHGDNS